MASQAQIRQQITDQFIEALKAGGIPPWRMGWACHGGGLPTNLVSKRRYSGVNVLLLQVAAARQGFTSKYWGTFNQFKALGGAVKRRPDGVPPGRWGTTIVFFKPVTKTQTDPDTGKEVEVGFPILRTYSVFNLDQVEGAKLDRFRTPAVTTIGDFMDFEPAERAIEATAADIRHGGDRAFYHRPVKGGGGDYIRLPHKRQFDAAKEYYATAWHELAHWSETRLGWSGSYALGELRAEIAASFLLAELGVPQSDDLTNHQAYVAEWLKALHDDPRFIFTASTAASKAADFLLSFGRPAAVEPEEEPEAALVA
jgi:antirestriction protein ArdC